ncbi:MAG: putative lipid II flippase FtsW [Bifidobacteriaceae bacterium]|jgi:cell division protein FtsW|nr:putative lipid II flippase FtsW [Bifidobacteriaceae bacterium]
MAPERLRSLRVAYLMVLIPVIMLTVIGLFMIMSANTITALDSDKNPYAVGLGQVKWAVAGTVLALGLAHCHRWLGLAHYHYRRWQGRAVAWGGLVLALVLQLMVFVTPLGCGSGGNKNWLCLNGQWTVQPSEFIKLGLALWLGSVLALKKDALTRWSDLTFPGLIGIGMSLTLVVMGDDAGTALVIGVMALGALVLAGVPWSKLAALTAVMGVLAWVAVSGAEHRLDRFKVTYNPELCDQLPDLCWQIQQAGYSLASGGWFGAGLGASRGKWLYLSQAESDFIFAIIGEELGLAGTLTILALFGVLGFGLFQIVRLHPDRSVQVAVGAIGCWIEGQALINMGMVIKLLPVVGVPLPFVSDGGSALVSCLMAIGITFGLMRTDPEVRSALTLRRRRADRIGSVVDAVPVGADMYAGVSAGGGRSVSGGRAVRPGRVARRPRDGRLGDGP